MRLLPLKSLFASVFVLISFSGAALVPNIVSAAESPVVTLHLLPRSLVQSDGSVDVLLRLVTDVPTEMHVMICQGKVLSGDPDKCDWQVDVRTLRNHRMIVENLLPSTTYSYRVQFITAEGAGVTTDRTFVTP